MVAIGHAAAQKLIDDAATAGLTAEAIADALRVRPHDLDGISGRDEAKARALIGEARERTELLDYVAFLATRMGHNPTERRGAADTKFATCDQLRAFIGQCEQYCRKNRISLRTAEPTNSPATPKQVDYIAKLLVRRTVESGFSGLVAELHQGGRPDLDAIRRLTKTEASQVIDSLTERY